MTKKDQIKAIASEFNGDEKKLIEKLSEEKLPDFSPREEFKEKLDAKIQEKIQITKEQKADQAALDAVPRKMKWRFYLTGYGYAVCSFLVLFLIGFCTNIFTGTLNIPSKYTYLEETQAFGDINKEELVYNYDAGMARNFSYNDSVYDYADDDVAESEEESIVDSDDASNSFAQNFMAKGIGSTITTANIETYDTGVDDDIFSSDYLLSNNFIFNQTYRFAYKDKMFPKLSIEYPVYKVSGILMGSNTPNQVLKNLKIGDVSFKNFQDIEMRSFSIQQSSDNGYSIVFDSYVYALSFYPNNTWQAKAFNEKLPSKRQILKAVEKDLKTIGVSLKNYGDGEVDFDNYDDGMGIINIFYPFKIQGKDVWNPNIEEKVGMRIAYDLNLQKVVSIDRIDVATYDVSNYPAVDKSYTEEKIEKGGEYFNQGALHENSTVILFDNMEIVYIRKYVNGDTYYVPAIKGETNPSIDNYKGPKYIFQEITE